MIEAGKTEYPRLVDWHVGWHTDQEEKHAHTRKKKKREKGSELLSFETQERWSANYGTFALPVLTFLILFLFYLLLSTYVLSFPMCYHHLLDALATSTDLFFFIWTLLFLFTWSRKAEYVRVKSSLRLREKKKTNTKYMRGKKKTAKRIAATLLL